MQRQRLFDSVATGLSARMPLDLRDMKYDFCAVKMHSELRNHIIALTEEASSSELADAILYASKEVQVTYNSRRRLQSYIYLRRALSLVRSAKRNWTTLKGSLEEALSQDQGSADGCTYLSLLASICDLNDRLARASTCCEKVAVSASYILQLSLDYKISAIHIALAASLYSKLPALITKVQGLLSSYLMIREDGILRPVPFARLVQSYFCRNDTVEIPTFTQVLYVLLFTAERSPRLSAPRILAEVASNTHAEQPDRSLAIHTQKECSSSRKQSNGQRLGSSKWFASK